MIIKKALLESEFTRIKDFLASLVLKYERSDFSLYLEDETEIVATISGSGNILKCLGVRKDYQGSRFAVKLVSEAIRILRAKGIHYFRVYTTPSNKNIFEGLGFKEIISSKHITLLESSNRYIGDVLEKLKCEYNINNKGDNAAIVLNCNPFTLGHRYLIEFAAKYHHTLILFILEEDKSIFKFKDRIEMVKRGVSDLSNVLVLPSTNYIISSLSFPSYFLKEESLIASYQAKIDAMIFKKYFIPIFGISKRYVGEETDSVTRIYNEKLKDVLADDLIEIERLKLDSNPISASFVRRLLHEKDYESVKKVVPSTTFEYLKNYEKK